MMKVSSRVLFSVPGFLDGSLVCGFFELVLINSRIPRSHSGSVSSLLSVDSLVIAERECPKSSSELWDLHLLACLALLCLRVSLAFSLMISTVDSVLESDNRSDASLLLYLLDLLSVANLLSVFSSLESCQSTRNIFGFLGCSDWEKKGQGRLQDYPDEICS